MPPLATIDGVARPSSFLSTRKQAQANGAAALKAFKVTSTSNVRRLQDLITKLGEDHNDVQASDAKGAVASFASSHATLKDLHETVATWTKGDIEVKMVAHAKAIEQLEVWSEECGAIVLTLRKSNAKARVDRAMQMRRSKIEKMNEVKAWSKNGVCNAQCEWLRLAISHDDSTSNPDAADVATVKAMRVQSSLEFNWLQPNFCKAADEEHPLMAFKKMINIISQVKVDTSCEKLKAFIASSRLALKDSIQSKNGHSACYPCGTCRWHH